MTVTYYKSKVLNTVSLTRHMETEPLVIITAPSELAQQIYDFAWDVFSMELSIFEDVGEKDIAIEPMEVE